MAFINPQEPEQEIPHFRSILPAKNSSVIISAIFLLLDILGVADVQLTSSVSVKNIKDFLNLVKFMGVIFASPWNQKSYIKKHTELLSAIQEEYPNVFRAKTPEIIGHKLVIIGYA